jgi:hypothetical protein
MHTYRIFHSILKLSQYVRGVRELVGTWIHVRVVMDKYMFDTY